MKKLLSLIASALPHLNIAVSFTMLALFITDRFNRAMAFVNNDITKWMAIVFFALVIVQSLISIWKDRHQQ